MVALSRFPRDRGALTISNFTNGLGHWLAAICAAALLCACAQAPQQPRARDGSGQPSVVSLNPCLDALLVELADDDQILALSHYSRDPASSSIPQDIAGTVAVTGGTVEEVLALEPDIVLASSFIAPATRAAFERLDVRVETFGSPASAQASFDQIERVAALAGQPERAGDLIARIERSLAQAANARRKHGKIETLLWQPGQIVAGEGELVTFALRNAGFVRDADKSGLGQGDYVSLESLIADPPDLALIAGNSVGQQHPALNTLEDTHIAALDPSLFYCGGPSLIALGDRLEQLRSEIKGRAR